MKNKITVTIIISQPPISHINAKEAVDLALVCAAFEQPVNLIFINEGVFHLLKTQDEQAINDKLHDRQLKALSFYDIDNIYLEESSLIEYGLSTLELIDNVELLSAQTINKMSRHASQTLIF